MKKSQARKAIKSVVDSLATSAHFRSFRACSFTYSPRSAVCTVTDVVVHDHLKVISAIKNGISEAINNAFPVQARLGINQTIVITIEAPIDEAIRDHQNFQKLRMGFL